MYQAELVDYMIKTFPNLGYEDARNMLQIVFITIRNALLLGESINLPGMGTIYPEFLPSDIKLMFKSSKEFERRLTEKLIGHYDEFVKKIEKKS